MKYHYSQVPYSGPCPLSDRYFELKTSPQNIGFTQKVQFLFVFWESSTQCRLFGFFRGTSEKYPAPLEQTWAKTAFTIEGDFLA